MKNFIKKLLVFSVLCLATTPLFSLFRGDGSGTLTGAAIGGLAGGGRGAAIGAAVGAATDVAGAAARANDRRYYYDGPYYGGPYYDRYGRPYYPYRP